MPKIRTHKGTQKRFRLSGTGKVMRRHSFQSHLLEHKSQKRKRLFTGHEETAAADARAVKRAAPYL